MKQHDTWPPLEAVLSDQDGPLDLTTADVRVILRPLTGAPIGGACTIPDASAGLVRYDWAAGDTDVVMTYNGEFEITWGDGEITTVPNEGYFSVEIVADLD